MTNQQKLANINATLAALNICYARRRYGSTTFTWVTVNGVDLGDPWPCVTPKRTEVLAAYQAALVTPSRTFES